MIRLFVALALPDDVRAHLAGFRAGVEGARWLEPETMHLTVRFIGEVDEGLAREIDAALTAVRCEPFEVTIRGLGMFGADHRAKTLWAGVDRSEALFGLKTSVEAALRPLGLEPDTRKYTPHITLARLRNPNGVHVRDFVETNNLDVKARFLVEAVTLYSSVLTKAGPHYQAEAIYPLS